jgi:hypothetical protein
MAAPPTIRDIPPELGDLFDAAGNYSRAAFEESFEAATAALGASWTAAELEAELRRTGTLEAFLSGTVGAQAWADYKQTLLDPWYGPLDDFGRRESRYAAPAVESFVGASDAAQVQMASPGLNVVRSDWWKTSRWTQRAVDWASDFGAQRVTLVSDTTKAGIRNLLAEAFSQGQDRDWIALAMRTMDGDGTLRLGLDARRAKSLVSYVADLDPSIPDARAKRMIAKRYKALLRARTITIAQTEVVTVGNEAQMETYKAAMADGELDAALYLIEWAARTIACPRCIAMDGSTREIGSGMFHSLTGETAARPDLHPNGWCFTRIIRRQDAIRLPVTI